MYEENAWRRGMLVNAREIVNLKLQKCITRSLFVLNARAVVICGAALA